MTYSPLVAAQTDAKYLVKQTQLWDGDLMISGHSKVVAAIYAAATQAEDVQLRIVDIFCFILLDCTVHLNRSKYSLHVIVIIVIGVSAVCVVK